MHRRNFLKNSCAACLAVTALPLMFGSCATVSNTAGHLTDKGLLLTKNDFLIKEGSSQTFRSSVIVRNIKLNYPICVFRNSDTEFVALWMQCSHQGAELQAAGDILNCPAHGSEFNNKGIVLTGPASRNLRSFPVVIDGDEIFIDLQKKA